MKCEPYEKSSVRNQRDWNEAASLLGVHSVILREIYLTKYCCPICVKDFISIIKDNKDEKFIANLKNHCAALIMTESEITEKEEQYQEHLNEADFSDLLNYRLKTLIEVGDEWLSDETKTYIFSEQQYLTKGKRYQIQSLTDRNGSEFGITTTTDLEKETNLISNYSCKSIWRNGKEIWNWHLAYLELWREQNPEHPQTQEMIDYCTKKSRVMYPDE